jgi:endonuclease/exonuclease/phosphatase family metal-dependent hydrolase
MKPVLRNSGADIIALQELPNAKRRLGKAFLDYHLYIPPQNTRRQRPGYNHNILLSKLPIIRAREVAFPSIPGRRRVFENCICVDVDWHGKPLRVYNCHLRVFRAGLATRMAQLEHLLRDAASHDGPTVICGDMNVNMPRHTFGRAVISLIHQVPRREFTVQGQRVDWDERELFASKAAEYGFQEALDLHEATWSPFKSRSLELFKLKLDWCMVKNAHIVGKNLGNYLSDHKPLHVLLSAKQ